ncbi:hypothetical protein PJM27_19570 [Mycobacterium kansasii]
MTTTTNPFPHIPLPPGATGDEWEENLQRPGYSRSLTWASYDGPGGRFSVDIGGAQQSDGSYTRHISIWGVPEGEGISSNDAHELGALLIAAADELDRLG